MNIHEERFFNLDLLRIIAVIAVIVIHTSGSFLVLYDINSPEHLWGNILDSTSRFAVPVFIMISGALMLNENKTIATTSIYKKKIKKLIILLIFWSSIYVIRYDIIDPLFFDEAFSLKNMITHFLTGHYHMWYIYMTIGLYLITPFLRCFVKYENRNMVLCFIIIGLFSQFMNPLLSELAKVIPLIENISIIIKQLSLDFFGGYTVYYLTGWYIVHVGLSAKVRNKLTTNSIIALFIIFVYIQATNNYDSAYNNFNIFIYLYSIGLFSTIFNLKFKNLTNIITKQNITTLSKLTFGVYIMHLLVLGIIKKLIIYQRFPLLYIFIISSLTAILSFLLSYLLSKNNCLKKFINM